MKKITKNFFALLPVAALLMLSACGSDSDLTENVKPEPQDPTGAKEIGFTVMVDNSTRASIAGDQKTLSFAEGDQLLITGTNISGTLPMTSGAGTQSAVFTGTLTYTGSGTPASDLALTGTLISSTNIGINTTTGAVDYGTAICSTLDEAVAQYCLLTGTSTYGTGQATFHLTPHTAFLNFTATLPKGYTNGSNEPLTVTVDGTAHTGNATISVMGDAAPVVKFVVPVAAGTSLSGATVNVGRFSVNLGSSKTTEAKVYNVNKTIGIAEKIPEGVKWVQLWEDGPEIADRNIGATSETGFGDYFAWGEVESKEYYYMEFGNYEWGTKNAFTKYNDTDREETLLPEDDAAYWNWGGNCRMPTPEELGHLVNLEYDEKSAEWVDASTPYTDGGQWTDNYNGTGVAGYVFSGVGNFSSNKIFLPAAGNYWYNPSDNTNHFVNTERCVYWSSSLLAQNSYSARQFFSPPRGDSSIIYYSQRFFGCSVRAVRTN